MGPAALTTIMLNVNSYGYLWTVVSLIANLALVLLAFTQARTLTRKVGKAGERKTAISVLGAIWQHCDVDGSIDRAHQLVPQILRIKDGTMVEASSKDPDVFLEAMTQFAHIIEEAM